MRKFLLAFFMLVGFPAFAEEWKVIETTRTYQVKILQPYTKYENYDVVWQKLLMYNRTWFVAKVMWDCKNKMYTTLVTIASYRDDPPAINYNVKDTFHPVIIDSDQLIFNEVCKQ